MNLDIKSLRQCIYCHNFCKFSCPSYVVCKDQKIIQNQKNYLLYLYNRKDIEADSSFGKSVYLCNDCKRCETYCIYSDKNVQANDRYSKEVVFKAGFAPEKIYEIEKNLASTKNIFGIKNKPGSRVSGSKEYEVFIYSGDFTRFLEPQILESFKILLEKLNISYIYDDDEISDGTIPLDLGMEEIAKELMKTNFNKISEHNFKKLIVLDPYSYQGFKEEYPRYGLIFECEIMHYSEYLEGLLDRINVARTNDKLKYFDPCRLGRGMGIYEAPRNILKKLFGADEIDFFKNREQSWCCGGYISLFDEGIANQLSSDIIRDFMDYGSGVLISACPLCLNNLKKACKNNRIKIYDILEFISLNIKI